jgi:uncharacterized protein YkwD
MNRRLLLASLVAAPLASVPVASAAAQTRAFDAAFERFRREARLTPTHSDATLVALAQTIAADNAARGLLDHRDASGRDLRARAAATGIAFRIVAENLAVGAADELAALDLWIASPPHRANLELPALSRHGLASAGRYWALVLAG